MCVCEYQKVVALENRLYQKGTVTGTMVDLGEITSQDPDPGRTKLIFILVEKLRISQWMFYKTLSHIRRCFIRWEFYL